MREGVNKIMAGSINKPKVFLSHSSIDKPFINRLYEDLRKCKIDAWLDSEEIRDGRSWLKVIFQDGIPACDAVMVYLTENSLKSKMVEKELDAAILHQLDDGGVVVLPYVSTASVRDQLRADLRTLHCRVWNEQNYQEILPSVVAEIWHSYVEKAVNGAVLGDRNRSLALEPENQQQSKEELSEDEQARAIDKIIEWLEDIYIPPTGKWINYKDIAFDTYLETSVIKDCIEYAALRKDLKIDKRIPGSVYIIIA